MSSMQGKANGAGAEKESWVRCDACKTWFHWRCAGEGDLDAVGKWYVAKRESGRSPYMLMC